MELHVGQRYSRIFQFNRVLCVGRKGREVSRVVGNGGSVGRRYAGTRGSRGVSMMELRRTEAPCSPGIGAFQGEPAAAA